jgi:hypothetical protein
VADWVTLSSLATAGGTLVLAAATFSSVRSANRAARVAEESLLAGVRPLLLPSRPEDPAIKVGFVDDYRVMTPGGGGTADAVDGIVYLTMSVRNAGTGIAVLDGWHVETAIDFARADHPPVEVFRRLTRDLYLASGDVGFWQGAFRDPSDPDVAGVIETITARTRITIDLLYGDHLGGQRVISRFSLLPYGDDKWVASVVRHWNIDRPDPR